MANKAGKKLAFFVKKFNKKNLKNFEKSVALFLVVLYNTIVLQRTKLNIPQ